MTDWISHLPRLGVGVSGEYGSASRGIDAVLLRESKPDLVHFYEYGADIDRGLDEHVLRWVSAGLPTTYHFLDVNLAEREDVDDRWLESTVENARRIDAAWLCGDAGLWHFGPRERGHQLLLPPVLCRESALETAESIGFIQDVTGFSVLPENPPSVIFLGEMHILDWFALVSERSGCGILLDCAHLAIFQRLRGLPPLAGLDNFPLDRVVEMHVAGGSVASVDGFEYVEDGHLPEPIPDTWQIFEYALARATSLRAVCYECENNQPEACVSNFERLNRAFPPVGDAVLAG